MSTTAEDKLQTVATTFVDSKPDAPRLTEFEVVILTHQYDEHTTHGRHTETQRSTMMTFVVTGTAAILAALATVQFKSLYWPLSLVAALLGTYATIMVGIYHERWEYHMMMARGFRWRIEAARPDARIAEIRSAAKVAHKEQFPKRKRLYLFWRRLGIGITLVGVACAVGMLIAPLSSSHAAPAIPPPRSSSS